MMLEAKGHNMVRHVGVSNFSIPKLEILIEESDEIPEMNQIELHPYLQQNDMLEFCSKHGIHLTAYSPLGSGDRAQSMKAANEPSLLEDKIINQIAKTRSLASSGAHQVASDAGYGSYSKIG